MIALARRLCTTKDGRFIVGQYPNGPVLVALALTGIALLLRGFPAAGHLQNWSDRSAAVAWIYWSGLELFTGVNTFRRLLGAVVLFVSALGLFRSG